MNSIIIAVTAGAGGMLGWGLSDFFAKKTVDLLGSIKSLAYAHVFGVLLLLILLLPRFISHENNLFPKDTLSWLIVVFLGILQMTVYWLLYEGFKKGQLIVISPIFASYVGLVALISVLFFNEKLTFILFMALFILFAGIILLNTDEGILKLKKRKIKAGLKEAIAASVLAAIWTLSWGRFVSGRNALSYTFFMYLSMSISAVVAFLLTKRKKVLQRIKVTDWLQIILVGACEAIAYYSITWGFSRASNIGIVVLISGCFSLPTIILARYFLKEKFNRTQIIASLLIVSGIILVLI